MNIYAIGMEIQNKSFEVSHWILHFQDQICFIYLSTSTQSTKFLEELKLEKQLTLYFFIAHADYHIGPPFSHCISLSCSLFLRVYCSHVCIVYICTCYCLASMCEREHAFYFNSRYSLNEGIPGLSYRRLSWHLFW